MIAAGQSGTTRESAIELRELRYFVQVARAGSFSRAAEELNVAQPALSRQLRKLEEELGIDLLLRHGRGVRLTKAGSLLLDRAEALLGQVRQLPAQIKDPEDSFAGQVTLGLPPAAGLLIAPEIVTRFRQRWPHATLYLREGVSSSLEEWLLDRRLDIAVLHNPAPLPGLDIAPVLQEKMVVAGPPRDSQAPDETVIRWRDLAEIPLILPSLPHSNRRFVEQEALRHGVRLTLALEVDSVPMTKAMVRRGFGSTILTFAAVAGEVARGELSVRHIDHPPLISTISIAMPHEAKPDWLSTEFFNLLRDVIGDLVASGAWADAHMVGKVRRRRSR